jgi:V8-like Glu-specific endopeptidase
MKYLNIISISILLFSFPIILFGQLGLEIEQTKLKVQSGLINFEGNDTTLIHTETIETDFNRFLQVHFSDYNLDGEAFLKIYSEDKPEWFQIFNSQSIKAYDGYSAAFSSDKLIVEIYGVNSNPEIFFEIDRSISRVGIGMSEKTICGSDNRVLSSDVRVARMFAGGGCTAWLMSNGTVITAGHCIGSSGFGTNTIIEFNVPLSSSGGIPNPSAPEDQYVIDITNVSWEDVQIGRDWGIMGIIENSTTGLMPAIAQGDFFRPTLRVPTNGSNIRITGYGIDSDGPAQNMLAQQSHSDNFLERINNSASGIFDKYQADTEGANSGSPVIRSSNQDFTYGIHTHGGCNQSSTNGNSGTSFDYNPLQIEMNDFWSTTSIHVDKISDYTTENGTIFQPYDTIEEAQNAASLSTFTDIILIKGIYNEVDGLLLNKVMLLHAPVGDVLIK